jgi:hypothetical protein
VVPSTQSHEQITGASILSAFRPGFNETENYSDSYGKASEGYRTLLSDARNLVSSTQASSRKILVERCVGSWNPFLAQLRTKCQILEALCIASVPIEMSGAVPEGATLSIEDLEDEQ